MAREIKDRSRVTVFRLIHMWSPRRVGIAAYASTGNFGDTAVIGYIPFPEIPDLSLMDIAARHYPAGLGDWRSPKPLFSEACWLLCTGSASRTVPKPDSLEFPNAEWKLEIDGGVDLDKIMYGHTSLRVGRFTFEDPDMMEKARAMLKPGDIPEMNSTDKPAHVD